ncbi:SDR family NAD(P)-dependent oxidoreductase [Campylobacter canadensis]|uniref:SDR family NAD(P)-dependent oxidoreductase n=1 Tax=Campylobacter canadensis TaxID=449520 RepID=A0ABS7WQG4_9BACT|nr:SDR family NAD(P)-dependent oxidoreductase [Campylobacter canadensis]MBZ7986999.1 SDR family NAD(P)-dependent oxidoreductase [Campylobacter canadensis]MBZ7995281.1 SDR family NAD(P)-dependent oxidoreductase [Campylobacter canadensis]MBZ7997177.1 SDR family NAD(P)-dependent oxidoreductase [Campylobacter canadensis]MBZ7998035.1 SDR family NAD(P)-dependent oxidoreductase [Campylobacter canadensis]MBZ8000696.1 SDR family NAD(P)-dependent oxidoreductase [Campylobacter canadensis]
MKTAFITGASSGFGKAIAQKLLENNYKCVLLARRKEKLEEFKKNFNNQVHIIACDVRDKNTLFKEINALPLEFKKIDVLVNSAGLALGANEFHKMSIEDMETMVDTNIKGLLYVSKAVLEIMTNDAYIFNFGSVAANYPYFGANVYAGTKAFVGQFSLALRNDLRHTNIKVCDVAPGLCKTEFSIVRFKGDINAANKVYENTKYLSAEDIAEAVFSILSLNSYVNINRIELMPQTQTWSGFHIVKDEE